VNATGHQYARSLRFSFGLLAVSREASPRCSPGCRSESKQLPYDYVRATRLPIDLGSPFSFQPRAASRARHGKWQATTSVLHPYQKRSVSLSFQCQAAPVSQCSAMYLNLRTGQTAGAADGRPHRREHSLELGRPDQPILVLFGYMPQTSASGRWVQKSILAERNCEGWAMVAHFGDICRRVDRPLAS
jgi:hypothetical protein